VLADGNPGQSATHAASAPRAANRQRRISGSGVFEFLNRFSLVFVLAILLVVFSAVIPDSFFTVDNFRSIANEQIIIVFLAIAVTMPLIVGEFDLSVGYVLGLAQALVVGFVSKTGMHEAPAILVVLLICAGIGLINGLLVVRLHINALIATLATGSILTGMIFWYTGGQVLFENVPESFVAIARREVTGIPLPIWYAAVVVAAVAIFFSYFPTGRRMYAIGGNRQAALISGIRVDRLIITTFVVSALLSGVAGVLIASRLGTAQPGLGPQFLLPAFAAAFLGATTIRPGRFNVLGAVVAVYVLAVPISGLQQLGVPSWFEYVFNGAALIVAVSLSNQMTLLRQARARRERLRSFERARSAETTTGARAAPAMGARKEPDDA
jgi:ribose transport system permease protein